ncbi:MAG: tol-pal system protein YbgF [Candidatus Rokubacteria bacterium]|nr:tol-pal system protein YbgF [Candidatus Rokubacteria bacterium]
MTRPLVALVVVVTIAASGCAWRGDVKRLRAEVRHLTEAVNTLSQPPSPPPPVSDERARADLKTLSAQVTAVESRLAETSGQLQRLDARLDTADRVAQDTTAKLDSIQAAVTKLEANPAPRATPPPPPSGGGAAALRVTLSPERAYAAALKMFRAREHGQAVLDFLDFLARHPKHRLAGNAQYWIGEAYFVQRDYRQAVVEFEKVLEHGLGHPKVPDALLRTGMAWHNVRDTQRAVDIWKRVMREYPKSDAARKAETLLASVGPAATSR